MNLVHKARQAQRGDRVVFIDESPYCCKRLAISMTCRGNEADISLAGSHNDEDGFSVEAVFDLNVWNEMVRTLNTQFPVESILDNPDLIKFIQDLELM